MPPGGASTPIRKRIGQKRNRVEFLEGVAVVDELHGQTQTWPRFGEGWAAIDSVPFVVSETEATVLYQVTTDYRADVVDRFEAGTTVRVRALESGKTMKVLAIVNPEERNRDLVLHCGRVFED